MTLKYPGIDYKALSKIVRKEAGDIVERVLTRNEMQGVFPGCIGVGSPFIVNDPDTYQPQMLFTAWSDVSGLARQVWVADIDEDLSVRNMRRIADGSLFNVTGLNTCTAFWDDYNEQWIFACTAYGAPKQSYGYFIFFDKNWNIKGTQVIDFAQTVDTKTWTPNLGDAGIGLVPHFDKGLTLSAGYNNDRSLFYISDYTQRPLPNPTRGLPLVIKDTTLYRPYQASNYYSHGRDVHQLFVYNGQLIMLSEVIANTKLWRIEVLFGPDKDWYMVANFNMVGKYHFVNPVFWPHANANYTHMTANQMMHPHYTTLLGRPLLFYMTSPNWNAGGSRRYAHEIWVQAIKPEEAFNPAKNLPLAMGGANEPYIVGKIPIPTFGAKNASIYIFGAAASGTLTLYESTSPYHIWNQTATINTTTYSINLGSNKIVVSNPMPYIGIATDVNISEWMVYLT